MTRSNSPTQLTLSFQMRHLVFPPSLSLLFGSLILPGCPSLTNSLPPHLVSTQSSLLSFKGHGFVHPHPLSLRLAARYRRHEALNLPEVATRFFNAILPVVSCVFDERFECFVDCAEKTVADSFIRTRDMSVRNLGYEKWGGKNMYTFSVRCSGS